MSSLSHHYSWHKALISRKPLLDFLLPTSAYQQAGLSSFTTHNREVGGGQTTDVWKIQTRRQYSLQKGTENEGNNYPHLPKPSSLADSEEGCEKLPKSPFESSSPGKTMQEVATPEFPLARFVARETFTPLKSKRALKIKFRCHKTRGINNSSERDPRSSRELHSAP